MLQHRFSKGVSVAATLRKKVSVTVDTDSVGHHESVYSLLAILFHCENKILTEKSTRDVFVCCPVHYRSALWLSG